MTYAQAIQFLYDLQMFGAKLGLETTLKLAALAGNPQQRLRFIHVAGTNGKGSTCAMLESIYRAAGLKVGLYTSPHLVSFAERIQVNRQLIAEADVVRLVQEIKGVMEKLPNDQPPTLFEAITVMALKYFAEQKCDLVIWETGLGGRLDATNIVTPLASVITNVQLDHQKWLGETLDKIAFEKAGIIKPGVPVITSAMAPEALRVIEKTSEAKKSKLTKVSAPWPDGKGIPALPLLGEHQRMNAAVAVATVHVLAHFIPVDGECIRQGLQTVHWAGRLQELKRGSQTILLDGAHNIAGAEALAHTLQQEFSTRPAVVLGILGDKDWEAMCRIVASTAEKIFLVPVQSERTKTPQELADVCARANPKATTVLCSSFSDALQQATHESFLLITGSLYLVGEAMELLQISSTPSLNERRLNEWSGNTSNKS